MNKTEAAMAENKNAVLDDLRRRLA